MISRVSAAALCAGFGLLLTACNSTSSGGAIATVNGQQISRASFDNKLESSQAGRGVLNQLIQSDLIDQYAKENNINPTSAQIDDELNKLKARYPNGQFDMIVKQQGLTDADVRNILRQQLVLQQAVAKRIPPVTQAQVAAFFKQNHAMFDKPEQVRARHILVPDLKTAEMVEAKLKAGGNFAALAKQYSADPASKDKGGELGFFGHGQMVQPFDQAAFSLPIGKISEPVKSPFGYHIIQVEERKPAVKATLAGSEAQIRQTLMQQAEQQQIQPFLQELRSKATISVSDPRFADLASTPLPPAPSSPAASAAPPSPAAASPAATK
ncbi:MAG TPA: peptidylprolyl isomerase [Candidatus Acidoferrales bacterium]|nr:peptidylprolyl isomerase [Candidatus Acidoferrales bacterium]